MMRLFRGYFPFFSVDFRNFQILVRPVPCPIAVHPYGIEISPAIWPAVAIGKSPVMPAFRYRRLVTVEAFIEHFASGLGNISDFQPPFVGITGYCHEFIFKKKLHSSATCGIYSTEIRYAQCFQIGVQYLIVIPFIDSFQYFAITYRTETGQDFTACKMNFFAWIISPHYRRIDRAGIVRSECEGFGYRVNSSANSNRYASIRHRFRLFQFPDRITGFL